MFSYDDVFFYESTALRADYNLDGTKDTLYVDFDYDYPESDEYSFPVTITLTIGDLSAQYENTWNDGVSLSIADFDTSDDYLDIYIISVGTDMSAHVSVYSYDGVELYEYLSFDIIEDTTFYYDMSGYLYFKGEYEGEFGIPIMVDYNTGDVYTID
jgi:hypothetical protein